jgi:hypothetical protein
MIWSKSKINKQSQILEQECGIHDVETFLGQPWVYAMKQKWNLHELLVDEQHLVYQKLSFEWLTG